ncbi:MAG: 50S ribosomal protein L17 [Syntrophaceae bacterium]|nr:50S ribosomal protein L17 [Syntrophaceae bacterium]MBP8608478.1 50S ribosomal protein L17 [Syntrophaceae bacterium]NMD05647.1 50S ribosomal protein L17 [Deltaproteobacteria bacterium]
MYHGKAGRKLGRTSSHRESMFRNMVTSVIKRERIRTTDAKAKELRKIAEKMITLGKRGDLHARRQVLSFVRDKEMVKKLFGELSERYRERNGGYTRIVKAGYRAGDNAPVSILELISDEKKKERTELKSKAKKRSGGKAENPAGAKTTSKAKIKPDKSKKDKKKEKVEVTE